ncbi:MAG: putative oxidoreductase [Microbacteriaceae bacterium]|nr:putative oxidoreductase [Microbacteriaceae bacterium]
MPEDTNQLDLLVLGGGGAGLAAAASAASVGARVLVLESESAVGGSTKLSSGLFSAAGTSVQKAMGIADSPDLFYQHYMDLNGWRMNSGLIRAFCEAAAPTLEWLISLGVQIPPTVSHNGHEPGLNQAGVGDIWRAHSPAGQGAGVVEVLDKAATDLGVTIEFNSRADRLIVEDGVVVGAAVGDREYRARAVLVATGGLSHDRDLLTEFYPRAVASSNLFEVAAPGSRGDHIRFGRSVGADISGAGRGLLLLTADFQQHHHWEAGFPPKSRIYINQAGRRFTNEDVSYSVSTGIFDAEGGWAWSIFDENGRLSLTDEYLDWTPEVIAREAAAGVTTVKADTLEGLAEVTGLPLAALEASIARWNTELGSTGEDPHFFRHLTLATKGAKPEALPRIETGPFYAVKMRPSELICTHAGLAIDESARVLDEIGNPIPGLYAAGEAGGGVLGDSYVGGGNSVANAFTMGRIAGLAAARQLATAGRN